MRQNEMNYIQEKLNKRASFDLIEIDKNDNCTFNDPIQGFTFDNESCQQFNLQHKIVNSRLQTAFN